MSADANCVMRAPALIAAAEKVTACRTFFIIEGGSRHTCNDCGETEAAHVIVALREALKACEAKP